MPRHFELALAPFHFAIHTDLEIVVDNLYLMYGKRVSEVTPQTLDSDRLPYIDYELHITHTNGLRRFYKPQARFKCDQYEPFKPLNHSQAFAMLEWGMNWAIASYEMEHVVIHSGVLAKGNEAVLFPAPPGSGKSTMTAHLAFNGWRLLSDEMSLITPLTQTVTPFVRPICLKNESIHLAKAWFPEATFSSIAKDTHKGDVIHLAPPVDSQLDTPATIKAIVFPKYQKGAGLEIIQLNQAQAMHQFADNAFNFSVLGEKGFLTLVGVVEQAQCFHITYEDAADIQAFLEQEVLSQNNSVLSPSTNVAKSEDMSE